MKTPARAALRLRAWARRCRHEIGDAWTLYLLPGLPALLPWRAAWACYRGLSRFPLLLRGPLAERAEIIARTFPYLERAPLLRRLRLIWLLDAADLYLARKTPLAAAPGAHFKVRGEWPTGPFIAVSFHYGNGMWMLRDLQRKGRRTLVVAAPFEPGDYRGRRIYLAYSRTRYNELEHSAGAKAAYRPGVREKLMQALAAGDVVMSLLDLPPRLVAANQLPAQLLGEQASLPAGVLQLAAAAGVPLVPFWVEIDDRGMRTLVIEPARPAADLQASIAYFAALLDRLIRADPAAWNFWSEWPRWISDATAARSA